MPGLARIWLETPFWVGDDDAVFSGRQSKLLVGQFTLAGRAPLFLRFGRVCGFERIDDDRLILSRKTRPPICQHALKFFLGNCRASARVLGEILVDASFGEGGGPFYCGFRYPSRLIRLAPSSLWLHRHHFADTTRGANAYLRRV